MCVCVYPCLSFGICAEIYVPNAGGVETLLGNITDCSLYFPEHSDSSGSSARAAVRYQDALYALCLHTQS